MALAMRDVVAGLAGRWRKRGWDLALGIGLCGDAAGGQILISARVAAAAEGVVDAEEVGPLSLKGLARPVPTWSVRRLIV